MTESSTDRLSTGNSQLDIMLGGGLIPGTLTVVLGASGIGKTQLGISFAFQGVSQEGQPGILFDMTSRGDSQNHIDYAHRLHEWTLSKFEVDRAFDPDAIWDSSVARRDYMHVFRHSGRRVTAGDLDSESWRQWKQEQVKKLQSAIAFFYGNFIHGVRRCVIDGVEPTDKSAESIQFEMFEYIYHQILHKEHDWVARDLLRVHFRDHFDAVSQYPYRHQDVGCMLLLTSHEVMLDDLITRRIESGDVLSNANTIVLMGKTRDGNQMGRAIQIAKHRGSYCDEAIMPFRIEENGIRLED